MFDALGDKLQRILKTLRGEGIITAENLEATLREVRLALLEADVNFRVVQELLNRIGMRARGQQVSDSLTPAQEVIRIVRDELVEILGRETTGLTFSRELPSIFLLVGLQGSGKTTTAGKLARWLEGVRKRPLLVSTDVRRPAAQEQLAVIARAIQIPCFNGRGLGSAVELALAARKDAVERGHDVLVVDTAGRLHLDEELMQEVSQLRTALRPSEMLFVADAMIGQDAVRSAQEFHQRLDITGVILTKLDGDARGGAALSIHHVTGQPIKFVGVGEGYSALEVFHPERIVSRILGMGDVLSLIEKAAAAIDKTKALAFEQKVRSATFTLGDFRDQMRQLRKLGPLDQMLEMLPRRGPWKNLGKVRVEEKELVRLEAIINSMTRQERANHHIINGKRRRRIARGSGASVQQVNQLLRQYVEAQKMVKSLGRALPARKRANRMLGLGEDLPPP